MERKLSARQRRILEYLTDFTSTHSYPPSIREIQAACEISSTSVTDYNLKALEREGLIRRSKIISRGIELVNRRPARQTVAVPMLGTIAAGEPIPVPATGAWDPLAGAEELELPAALTGGHPEVYAVRVRGTSMIDALVADGDIVLLRPAADVPNGAMVAAWLKERQEATLKFIYREGERVRLQPANETMQPIYVPAAEVEVQGRVVGVLRRLA